MTRRLPKVLRFAPSPNGSLHLGHAYSALWNQRRARALAGTLLLRMEDIDLARCSPAHEAAIVADLAWLGVGWAGPMLRQSERFGLYRSVLDDLAGRGLLYPCFCARGDIARAIDGHPDWPRDPDGSPVYPGTCRHLSPREQDASHAAGRPSCLRLDCAAAMAAVRRPLTWMEYREGEISLEMAASPEAWGDAVLRRKDIPASYHVAVVADDAASGVSDVVRGEDLLPATSLHRLLQALLGYPAPFYHHHRLSRDAGGQKLSKSRGSPALADLRQQGADPADIRRRLGF